jgi:uncharacterized membrane protein YkoI
MAETTLFCDRFAARLAGALTVGALAAIPAAADTEVLGDCLEQVQEIKPTSDFVKVEYLSVSDDGDPSFEIEARDARGKEWEFMCEADDGNVYEIEQEATSVNAPLFKKNVKISEQQARQTVTGLYPGTIKEVEYEIESTGASTYEIDVVDAQNTQWKVEVDAANGDIIETHVEQWEIGEEFGEQTKK